MDFLTLMLLSEPCDKEKMIFFLNKIYQKHSCKKFDFWEHFPEENQRFISLRNYFLEHPAVNRSLERMKMNMDKHNEYILPIFYDHFISIHWERLFGISLSDYMYSVNIRLLEDMEIVPYKGGRMLMKLLKEDWLYHYKSVEGLVKINLDFHKINHFIYLKALNSFLDNYQDYFKDFNEYVNDLLLLIKPNDFIYPINAGIDLVEHSEKVLSISPYLKLPQPTRVQLKVKF